MKIKSYIAGVIIAAAMVAGPALACHTTGWHMVYKTADVRPAVTWQQYYSGVYLQPVSNGGFLFLGN